MDPAHVVTTVMADDERMVGTWRGTSDWNPDKNKICYVYASNT